MHRAAVGRRATAHVGRLAAAWKLAVAALHLEPVPAAAQPALTACTCNMRHVQLSQQPTYTYRCLVSWCRLNDNVSDSPSGITACTKKCMRAGQSACASLTTEASNARVVSIFILINACSWRKFSRLHSGTVWHDLIALPADQQPVLDMQGRMVGWKRHLMCHTAA